MKGIFVNLNRHNIGQFFTLITFKSLYISVSHVAFIRIPLSQLCCILYVQILVSYLYLGVCIRVSCTVRLVTLHLCVHFGQLRCIYMYTFQLAMLHFICVHFGQLHLFRCVHSGQLYISVSYVVMICEHFGQLCCIYMYTFQLAMLHFICAHSGQLRLFRCVHSGQLYISVSYLAFMCTFPLATLQ